MSTFSADPARVAIATPQGLVFAAIGPNVTLTKDPMLGWLLSASALTIDHIQVEPSDKGEFAVLGLITLYRNGIALTTGVDYALITGGARLTAQGMEPGDIWSALVQR